MFTIDENLRSISASRDQIVSLYQSINSPHLAIPGRQAGPAQAFIVGLRSSAGFSLYVYLYLAEVPDCAIYVSSQRHFSSEEYGGQEDEAFAFVESMGFMVDNMNFRSLPPERQAELLSALPPFQTEPKAKGAKPRPPAPAAPALAAPARAKLDNSFEILVGRIFSSF